MHMGAMKHRPEPWEPWVDAWVRYMESRRCGRSTIEYRRSRIYSFARYVGRTPADVTGRDVDLWLHRRGAGANTLRTDRCVLSSFFSWATSAGLRSDPVAAAPRFPRAEAVKDIASEADMARGRAYWDGRSRMMVMLAGDAGLRRGEIAMLRGSDLHADGHGRYLLDCGTGVRRRSVPVEAPLAHAISCRGCGYTFPGEKGLAHVCADTVWRSVRQAAGRSPDALRRRFAVNALHETGGDFTEVSRLMGMASVESLKGFIGDARVHD